ncbi:MAG: helix-turn-helix domain-containing protein [Pseudomonadota bacterium]
MTRTSLKDWNCSLARSLDIIGDKWAMLIVRNAFFGTTTFSGFQAELGIAKNILTNRLKHLTDNGILRRLEKDGRHPRYKLTPAGWELSTVFIALLQWGDKHVPPPGGPPLQIVDRETLQPIRALALQSGDGKPLSTKEVRFAKTPADFEKR